MNNDISSEYYYNFDNYKVLITYKRVRNIIYHYDKEKRLFKISAPYHTSQKTIYKHLDKFAPRLIARANKRASPRQENAIYVFGELTPIEIGNKNVYQDQKIIIKKHEDLNKVLKKILIEYLTKRVKEYETIMNTSHHKITVRDMKTRHGSNSYYKNHLSFAMSLVHYSYPIIDSVIIHELAHDLHHNHGQRFYDCVLKYCPNYKALKKALDNTKFNYGKDQQK
ncbi:MAG: M48 family metallopeptidase [Bacilli bacterium]|nr:M48 family metallopeptidase [Bacilli bacterium]